MNHRQFPVHSGFGAASTAAQVLAGHDLSGILAVVTGGHSGLGLETTRALAQAGARVIVGARDVQAAMSSTAALGGVEVRPLDLASLASVHGFAEGLLSTGRHIDMLICSAGIMACPETRTSAGWEAQFATNHLGHFALANLLWPALRGGSRVVAVSSAGHHQSGIRWHDVHCTQGYDKWLAYGQSKTANALFAVHLDELGRHEGIRAFSLHPGKIFTPLQRHLTLGEMKAAGWLDAKGQPADLSFKTPQQGAATQVWAATSAQLQGLGGLYCEDCEVAPLASDDGASFTGVCQHAIDPEQAERLWALSSRLTGVDRPHSGASIRARPAGG